MPRTSDSGILKIYFGNSLFIECSVRVDKWTAMALLELEVCCFALLFEENAHVDGRP